jgi:hypothetical protein
MSSPARRSRIVFSLRDPARADFDRWRNGLQSLVKHFHRVLLGTRLDTIKRPIDNALGRGFFSITHDLVHEFRQDNVLELWIRQNLTFLSTVTT